MHAVHYSIGARAEIRGALGNVSKYIKYTFPKFAHGKRTVGCIPVIEEGLRKKRKIPMGNKEKKDDHLQ
jgi:hypothetical protein